MVSTRIYIYYNYIQQQKHVIQTVPQYVVSTLTHGYNVQLILRAVHSMIYRPYLSTSAGLNYSLPSLIRAL